jgi:O-antigen/teichoic acid export membrane protein
VSALLIAAHRQRALLWINAGSCAGFIALAAALIDRLGPHGLAWAQVAAWAGTAAAGVGYAWRSVGAAGFIRVARAPAAAALLCVAAARLMDGLPFWSVLPVIFLTYALVMAALKGIQRHDLAFLKTIVLGGR